MNNEYKKLIEKLTLEIFNNSAALTKEAYKIQRQHLNNILDKVAKVLLRYTIKDDVMALSDSTIGKLKSEFTTDITDIIKNELDNEKELINDILSKAVTDKYYTNAYVMELGIDFNLKMLTDKNIKKIVNNALKGEVWSSRLWNNKRDLENQLNKEIAQFLKGKTSVNDIRKHVEKRFNQSAFNTERLVQTEVERCQNESNDLFAEEHGLLYQEFVATIDDVTSEFCRQHDGKVYKIDDPNKPYLPHHPFERSCNVNLPEEDWKPSKRRNNENGKIIDYKTYQLWYSEKVKS